MVNCTRDKAGSSVKSEADTATPVPWEDLEQIPLESARILLTPQIDTPTNPTELRLMPDRGLGFVLDADADRVHVLDGRYGQDGRSYCIDAEEVSRSTVKGGAAQCPDGTSSVHRGALIPQDRPVALGLDTTNHTALVLTRSGILFQADADVLRAHPIEYLALDDGTSLDSLHAPVDQGRLAAHEGRIAVAAQGILLVIDGEDITEYPLPGVAIDLVMDDDGPLVLTDAGVWSETGTIEVTGQQLVHWQDEWWLVQADHEQVLRLGDLETIHVSGITGPAATDPRTGVLHLASGSGLIRIDADGEQTMVDIEPILDLDINRSGETVLLHSGGQLSVLVDETAYQAATVLDVFITTFSERPRSSEDSIPCRGTDGDPSIESFLATARKNRRMLNDMPAPVAMGLTPALVDRATACDARSSLVDLIDHPATSSGILVHEEPASCNGDLDCHTDFISAMLASFGDDLTPTWASGMSSHHELDLDWVASMEKADFPNRYLFFGMGLNPAIEHHGDLRAKDAWPVTLGDMGKAWATDTAAAIAERSGSGWLAVYPGNDIPAFNLAGCSSLFLLECHPLLRGGGVVLDGEDVAILNLLLHRALTDESDVAVRTWYFHLPDIGTYDFTEGCTTADRTWTGDACSAARLQEWLVDVDRRLVSAGLVRWTLPGELEHP
jgi:hypothetical protein